MTDIPSFSSFPDLELKAGGASDRKLDHASSAHESEHNAAAGPSQYSAPTFSSFPDLQNRDHKTHLGSKDTERSRHKGSRHLVNEDSFGESRRFDKDKRPKRPRTRDRDDEGQTDRSRSDRQLYDEDEKEKKEARRRREREKAERLIRGDVAQLAKERPKIEREQQRDVWDASDGRAWYESTLKPGRGGYEPTYDPTSGSSWFKDSAGDKDAARYGASASYASPRYRRDGDGRVLGINEGIRIVFSKDRTEKGVELAPKGLPYVPRYSARTLEGSKNQHLSRVLLRPETDDQFDHSTGFVEFDSTQPSNVDLEDAPDYRDFARPSDAGMEEVVDSSLSTSATVEQDVRRRTADMERHLKAQPNDVERWISYSTLHLRLSPELANRSVNAAFDPLRLPQNRASAEVTLSILARGLDAHPGNFLSIPLHLAYLRAAEMFWPSDKITGRWKNVIRELGDRQRKIGKGMGQEMIHIWLGYIEWKEGAGWGKSEEGQEKSETGVDEVIEVYVDCLEKLRMEDFGSDSQAREENQLYLVLRACIFMRQAGYNERALACFQALIEITFFKPDHLRPPHYADSIWFDGVLSEFEAFWEDEGPRIGEPGAAGWRNALDTNFASQDLTPIGHHSENDFERWLEAERNAETTHSLPGRAKGLDDDEDPFRVVLFSDVQPFLFFIRSPEVRLQLVYTFLTFLGLPFSPPETPTTSPVLSDPHLRNGLAYNSTARAAFWPPQVGRRRLPWQTVGGEPMTPEASSALSQPFGCPVKCWASDQSTLFGQSGKWFRDLEGVDLAHVNVPIVRHSFTLLLPLIPDPRFTVAYFAFEAAISPKAAVKASKVVLSKDRENLLLWAGYAQLERQRGNIAAARVVCATALQSGGQSDEDDRRDLWASWAEMEYEHDEGRALEVVVMAAGLELSRLSSIATPEHIMSKISAISMLKARQHYASSLTQYSTSRLTLAALFAYLTDGVDASRSLVEEQISSLPSQNHEAEEAYQLLTRILHGHTSRHAAPASLSRDVLERAMKAYPDNTSFLSLYLFGELGNRVYGRVQRLVSQLSSADDAGIVGHLWAVWAESMSSHRTFWDKNGDGAERVRIALDKGINSKTGRHSVTLWRLYIEFESLMGRWNAAKQLCYRAVAAIGGCKELYLLPFEPTLRPHFTDQELREWAELMSERGIRVRVPFEGFFDTAQAEDSALLLPEDEELADDELKFLGDREVLKPY